MSDIAIRVENLGKRFHIRHQRPHDSLREVIAHAFTRMLRKQPQPHRVSHGSLPTSEDFWALKSVTFELSRGQVLGIIGHNGAGKSTLLKILSRITRPTEGFVEITGRVGSLLEVGTGFHPELSGRENIYLNGAILGMARSEIARRFDEIVAFSEIEKFLDTPVKRYSSGMYTRLAFAVAAHLEPEILIVDEVLAVGDVAFQRKCLGRMQHVAKEGRTVLFVSHNHAAVQHLCSRGLVLDTGRVVFDGGASEAIERYITSVSRSVDGFADVSRHPSRPSNMHPVIRSVALCGSDEGTSYRGTIKTGEDVIFEIRYDLGDLTCDYVALAVNSSQGARVLTVGTHLSATFQGVIRGRGALQCHLPQLALVEGEYSVVLAMGTLLPRRNIDRIEDVIRFRVENADYFGTGETLQQGQGYLAQRSHWRMVSASSEAPPPLHR